MNGVVKLVGAGPGAADLLTVRARMALEEADVIIVDYLVPDELLVALRLRARVVRLRRGADRMTQREIERLLIQEARAGRVAVHLKSGDPMVFARGLEELKAVSRADIAVEVIPGLSAGQSLSAAGVAPTRRGRARSVAWMSGRLAGGGIEETIPDADTVVVYMGLERARELARRMVGGGRSADVPAAIIENVGRGFERRHATTLGDLGDVAEAIAPNGPALLVVGEAAAAFGVPLRPRILFTGLDPARFRSLGDVVHWPAQRLVEHPLADSVRSAGGVLIARREVDLILFSCRHGVAPFFERLRHDGHDARVLTGLRVWADAHSTAKALEREGIRADRILEESPEDPWSARVLLVQGTHTSKDLSRSIETAAAEVTRVVTISLEPHPELEARLPDHDAVYFVSPAGVRAFARHHADALRSAESLCLGPAVAEEVERLGGRARIVEPGQSVAASPTGGAV